MSVPKLFCFLLVLIVASATTQFAHAADPALLRANGQTVYIPVYSHVHHGNLDSRGVPSRLLLSSMLSFRNTDPEAELTLVSVDYFDTNGKLIRRYLAQPRRVGPLASADSFVEHRDVAGGQGASFIVTWRSERPINPPLAETVNTYAFGTQYMVFTARGRTLETDSTK
ncbi:MAG: hypothetical protein A3G73_04840 [Rhodospirillales bacterium RIFCSPLOWO2_12_FULL_67_15]|nr:MAG: hypothetical protein A3G73_04840 [Rhodospirillales bacterium RIFCSPLOWO2_12_FULL_67_15]